MSDFSKFMPLPPTVMLLMFLRDLVNPMSLVVVVVLLLMSFKVRYYTVYCDDIRRYQKEAIVGTENENGKHSGTVFGKYFICWMTSRHNAKVLALISTHDRICKSKKEIVEHGKVPKQFTVCFRQGSFGDFSYIGNMIDVTTNGERPFQTQVIDTIMDIFNEKDCAVVLLAGPPGCGKSSVYKQLIRRLAIVKKAKCSFTNEFRMCDPGDKFSSLYTSIAPEEGRPLIILVDEIDGVLTRLGGAGVPQHLNHPIEIKNKQEWNSFLDGIDSGFYRHTIFLFTTNLTLDQIDAIDPSYTRCGRTDARFDISANGNVKIERHEVAKPLVDQYTGADG
jgi:hypothetical protein